MGSTTTTTVKDDAVSQVLGKDKPGRIRGFGRGVTATKLSFLQMNNSQVETLQASQAELRSQVDELKTVVQKLSHKNVSFDYKTSFQNTVYEANNISIYIISLFMFDLVRIRVMMVLILLR